MDGPCRSRGQRVLCAQEPSDPLAVEAESDPPLPNFIRPGQSATLGRSQNGSEHIESAYEYRGLKAETWDLFRGDTSGWSDRAFYHTLIRESGEPVLDVGCGTGRLLLDYLGLGLDVDGVDNSPEMLELCAQKANSLGLNARLFQQSMQYLHLPRKYRTIMVPSSSFQLLVNPPDATAAMRVFFDHLLPGGILVMPFMALYTDPSEEPTVTKDWHLAVEKTRPEDGAVIKLWSRTTYDLVQKLEHYQDRFEVIQEGRIVKSEAIELSPACRWYSQAEAVKLYREAGFVDITTLSGFTHEPAGEDDTIFCVLGSTPAS